MTEEEMSKIYSGVKVAISEAIERHRKLGESISIMRDGKIVTLTAEEIPQVQNNESSSPNLLE
jgi:ABC-type proline/glycine betaine transport system ATPase subunit